MASELRLPPNAPGAPGAAGREQLAAGADEPDPVTWYGLVWRIVRTGLDGDPMISCRNLVV
jgi:hypothetical protein